VKASWPRSAKLRWFGIRDKNDPPGTQLPTRRAEHRKVERI
jgi:hypothetical protein